MEYDFDLTQEAMIVYSALGVFNLTQLVPTITLLKRNNYCKPPEFYRDCRKKKVSYADSRFSRNICKIRSLYQVGKFALLAYMVYRDDYAIVWVKTDLTPLLPAVVLAAIFVYEMRALLIFWSIHCRVAKAIGKDRCACENSTNPAVFHKYTTQSFLDKTMIPEVDEEELN
jgi:hypothetical protein